MNGRKPDLFPDSIPRRSIDKIGFSKRIRLDPSDPKKAIKTTVFIRKYLGFFLIFLIFRFLNYGNHGGNQN
jgi:hypothetical protein